jgi:hypothetical protein
MTEWDGIEFPDEEPNQIRVEFKDPEKKKNERGTRKIPIRKFTGNGTMPLHESVIIGMTPKFVTLDKEGKSDFLDGIKFGTNEELVPNDTIYTQTPLPYIFKSEDEFKEYLEYAKKLDLDSLFSIIETEWRKYVDVEGYYYTLLVGDTIWSYFQDIFPYTHYIIIVGDNDAGKNSALLLYRFLGYRVFYVTSASAANYSTVLGSKEEGQVTTAEDEADDLARDKDKRNVFKTGYATGGSIPKVELEGGRKQENWLTYCQKWTAMEELPNDKNMKGIIDRSLVLKFVTGSPQYNIKEVIRAGKDPEYEPLYDKLMEIRKLLFCYRLLHREDQFLNVKLNVKNRTAELTKPLIRLFNKAPLTRQRILDDLSLFINERNENKKNTFEAKLYNVIIRLIKERKEQIEKGMLSEDEERVLGTHVFSNESIRFTCKEEMDGSDIDKKPTAFYSTDFGQVTQKKITNILKSKFKVDPPKVYRIGEQTLRCVKFKQQVLDKIKAYYEMPDKIQILENVTVVTDVTLPGDVKGSPEVDLGSENNQNNENPLINEPKIIQNTGLQSSNNTEESSPNLPETVTSVTSVTEKEPLE